MTTVSGTWQFTYDATGQLTSVIQPGGRVATYTYDAVGNRTQTTDDGAPTAYAIDNMNRYTSVGSVTYTYDADGRRIKKSSFE